ncbi:electron transport complex subunit RsxE [Maridesulfovibrio ferrireducens]|uniref:electron transport complex subunit RsxE n=1 Tax=Maridesulfovibrio ferrireducens TaxID=246191 RepID=UPI001A2719D2|nr:electron transport complex subunit E [Maridesulfovibrio ferrireducens]MBI9110217.1 electron transport complex subunit E [Maridesulfovibrio ferrireducens]
MSRIVKEFIKGLWVELPPFRVLLGLCPTLAVTSTAENGLGMGIAVLCVLTMSNMIISCFRKIIPAKVRIACFIVIAASLVVAVELLMQAYVYPLYLKLGIFVPLIVVNCLILGRAEAFASKNGVLLSVADALGMGIGFTVSLTFLGALREALGHGTIFGTQVMWDSFEPAALMGMAPGAFVGLGVILASMNALNRYLSRRKGEAPPKVMNSGCASCGACGGIENLNAK